MIDRDSAEFRTAEGDWLPIGEAGDRIGVRVEALRKRAQRASVLAKKDNEGQWVIFVSDGGPGATTASPESVDPAMNELHSLLMTLRKPVVVRLIRIQR